MKKLFALFLILGSLSIIRTEAQTPPACGTESNPCWLSPERPWVAPRRAPEIIVDGLWGTAATADLMLSERCISAHTCHEANPLLPANATITGASVLEAGETGLSMWAFHRFRQSHAKLAWIIPGANITIHALGIWSYMRGR